MTESTEPSISSTRKPRLVVVGNGMAGMRTVEELLKLAPDLYDITVFGAEPLGNYNRIMLSPLLAGEKTLDEIMINTPEWYAEHGITLHAGDPVVDVRRRQKVVVSASGLEAPYDRLLLTTGSNPFIIPVPDKDKDGVISFRDVDDVNAMLDAAKTHRKAAVIGGGLLGLEAANGLAKRGMEVTVIHIMDTLMERQLDAPAGNLLRQELESRGMAFRMQAATQEILGDDRVTGIRFADGSEVEADLVVMAVGIRPNIALAQQIGLHCERGIVVDDTMQTYDPSIYAIGECVQHRQAVFGLVAPIWDQAKVCASHLAQVGSGRFVSKAVSTKLKVTGVDLFSAGDFSGGEGSEDIVFQDPRRGVYKRLIVKDNRIAGAVLYGDTLDGGWYFDLMNQGADVSEFRDRLVFGQAFVDAPAANSASAADWPDDRQVCDCNGVCKGAIVETIQREGLKTAAEVGQYTKAGTSCGSCKPMVEQVLEATLGDDMVVEKPSICGCTDLDHDEVRAAIREQGWTDAADARAGLGWKQPDGCNKCRPALNYYVISTHPDGRDDPQSRFINERAHANIQKDGTYSVVPRMFGGLTSPRELRAIADVADKYAIPTVKVTGGQRIDLFGVKKEDLPAVWKDLREQGGLISGHAYGKSLRTVKTCVGSEWCRFGTQDSTGMGVQLERMTWGSWTPHKFKMAVSGCPRNCAETSIKDFGVLCTDSGYELQIGGNGGIKLRGADVLCRVTSEAEVLEYCGAFMQIYREEAHYLERTAPWIERVGLDYIRARVVDDPAGRQAAYARFLESQKTAQVDPWETMAPGTEAASEFRPLNALTGAGS